MQQQINLYHYLPKKTGYDLKLRTVLLAYGAFLLLLLMFHSAVLWQKHRLLRQFEMQNIEVAVKQQQLAMLIQQYPIYDLESLKKNIEQLQKEYETKEQTINLLSPYANFSNYLIGLGNAIVSGVWLTEIILDNGENKIALKGYTLQPSALAQFYSQLNSQPIFSNLDFEVNEIKQTSFPANFYITAKEVNKT